MWWSITYIFQFTYFLSLVICHLWYRFSINTEVLHSGIVPKPKLWYRAIPSWTGYMLMKVRYDLPEAGFVKVPRDDRGCVRVFVNVSAEHIVEFGQSQASVCLWWNVNNRDNDRWNLAGKIEWVADNGEMFQMRRAGTRQNGDAPGVTPFLVRDKVVYLVSNLIDEGS